MVLRTLRSFATVVAFAHAQHFESSSDDSSLRSVLSGKCFDVPGDDPHNNPLLWMWDCIGGDAQRWYFSRDNRLVYGGESKKFFCVDVPDGDTANGKQLQVRECEKNPDSQTWGFEQHTGTIYFGSSAHGATKCMQIRGENQAAPVEIWDCNGEGVQTWNYKGKGPASIPSGPTAEPTATPTAEPTDGTPIQSALSDMCVDVPGGDTSNGALLWMWECYAGEAQQWSFQNDELVYVPSANVSPKCLDLLGGNATNGNVLGLWDCYQGESQKWVFDSDAGTIRMASQPKCLQIGGGNVGDRLEIWDCIDGKEEQIWKVLSLARRPTPKSTALHKAEPTAETSAVRAPAPTLDSPLRGVAEIVL